MADYSINAVTRRVVYTGSAGVGPYAFSFEVLAQTDIVVYKDATKLTLTTDYTVTINANGTGSVTLVTAAGSGNRITILGQRAISRTTDFVTAGDLLASSLNDQLDSQIIMLQQLAEENKRTIKAPQYDPAAVEDGGTVNMVLPIASSRAGKVFAFDTNGNPTVGDDIGNWRGNWSVGQSYTVRDLVSDPANGNVYRCNMAHTSIGSAPIKTNPNVAKWDIVINVGTIGVGIYLGAYSTAPTTDGNGSALTVGDMYFDTSSNVMKVWNGTTWSTVATTVNGTSNRYNYVATAGQTTFTAAYDTGGFVDVFKNGVKLTRTVQFTDTSGTQIVLSSAASAGDRIDIIAYGTFSVASIAAASITSGTMATARLGSGTADATKYLAGDQTYKTLPVVANNVFLANTFGGF